jgi:hypothetical protein
MNSDPTARYFDNLVEQATKANAVPREAWAVAQPNCCHANCEDFVQRFPDYKVVRGWLVTGGHWFMPHSVVQHKISGNLIDITPLPNDGSAIPFVEHFGSEEDFKTLRQGRDGGWLHPPISQIPDGPTFEEYE